MTDLILPNGNTYTGEMFQGNLHGIGTIHGSEGDYQTTFYQGKNGIRKCFKYNKIL